MDGSDAPIFKVLKTWNWVPSYYIMPAPSFSLLAFFSKNM